MVAEIRQNKDNPESYDLFVNGVLEIKAELFIVVNNVKTSLIDGYHESTSFTEADKIACNIRKKHEGEDLIEIYETV